jgi:hypothetical protein
MSATRSKVASSVTIRMYRQGLGDAFLLGFHAANRESDRWVLIDCGAVGRDDAAAFAKKVAGDIVTTTKNAKHPHGHLHLLVVSNVRWNHVSGFVLAAPIFKKMKIDEIWLPATEDTGNEQARQRVKGRQKRLKDLHRVARDLPSSTKDLAASLTGVLGLFGDYQDASASPAAEATPEQSDAALNLLQMREQAGTRIRYLDARDEPQPLFTDPAVRVYVLGPGGAGGAGGGRALAAEKGALDMAGSFLAAAQQNLGASPDDGSLFPKELLERNLPFSPSHQTTFATNAEGGLNFKPPAYQDFFETRYFAESGSWRRVDYDWMAVARGLALALDQEANNASLVLAFELVKSKKVLLFPGDAQLSVWKSWETLEWKWDDEGIEQHVTASDLLRRTVVYKVAHHCSQTGTLIEGGLNLMERGDLVALLPVDPATAQRLGWDLPYAPLLKRLREKTRGRILITDPQEPGVKVRPRPDNLPVAQWQAFQKAVRETDLYIEYTLSA